MLTPTSKEIIQWDIRSWSKALRFWEKNLDWNKMHSGLEIGGNCGGLSLWMAANGVEALCSDLKGVEELAKPLHEKFGLSDRIQYQDIDATNIPYEDHFDTIAFKSVLGGVGRNDNFENQKKAIQQMYKALKPGGLLFFAENLRASPLHLFMRQKFVSWGDSWRYVNTSEMKELFSDFSNFEIHTNGFLATFGRNEGQRNLLARLDSAVFDHLVPKDWHYICYGFARK